MYDIIMKKRCGQALNEAEIRFFVEGFTNGEIPDYQASALLMAIYFQKMDETETALLTHYMAHSGDMADLSSIPGVKVDKHSTGGVGDKTSLIIGPIVAACGVPVAKMSGRGLGHTGGTIDKLESIPGLATAIEPERFCQIVRDTGLAIIGQTGNIAPADKKLYALRDVTATVDNLSLIASSIMSKKLAAGSDAILLDVKTGSGAFMKTLEESIALALAMVSIGEKTGRKTAALITDMDTPLGRAIGNSLEVIEAVEILRGAGPDDLRQVCLELASNMLFLAGQGHMEKCRVLAADALSSGRAFEKLKDMVRAQGGDAGVLEDTARFKQAAVRHSVAARKNGYITHMDTEKIGAVSVALGAGRVKKEDEIDYSAGLVLTYKTGDYIEAGASLSVFHTNRAGSLTEAEDMFLKALTIEDTAPGEAPFIYARVTAEGVSRY